MDCKYYKKNEVSDSTGNHKFFMGQNDILCYETRL
jgi:hypothetical protein